MSKHPLSSLTEREEDLRFKCVQQAILLHTKTSGITTKNILTSAELMYKWILNEEEENAL